MKYFVCNKCHKTFTSNTSIGACPFCHSINISYLGLAESALKALAKILTKKS